MLFFGEKAKDVRDTSQRMNNSGGGKVIGVKIFSRENGHELKAGVLKQVQIFVAQLRKISVGDKMAGDMVTRVLWLVFFQLKTCHLWRMVLQ